MLKTQPDSRHILILGVTGRGKSHAVKSHLAAGRFGPRVLVVDVQDEYDEVPVASLRKGQTIEAAIAATEQGQTHFAWRFPVYEVGQVDYIFQLAMALGSCTVIAEEVSFYHQSFWFQQTLMRGRRHNIQVVVMSQRPYVTNVTVRSQCRATVAFFTDEPRDADYIRDRYGTEAADELATLDPDSHDCCVFGDLDLVASHFDLKSRPDTGGPAEDLADDTTTTEERHEPATEDPVDRQSVRNPDNGDRDGPGDLRVEPV